MADARFSITADDRSKRAIRSVRSSMRDLRREVVSLEGATVALASTAAMGAVVQRSLQATAQLSEQADVAGVTAEKYQELTKAFSDMAGVQEDITSGGLRRFNRRLDLARQGTGAAADTLERMNISLEQGTGPALEEAIRKLAQMAEQESITGEASQLFGEDAGPKMAAALSQGQEALDQTIAKLREQNRIMSDESVQSARELNDRYNELADTLKTNLQSAIVNSIDGWRELLGMTEGAQYQALQGRLESLRNARDRILENMDSSPWPDQLRDSLKDVNEEMLSVQREMQAMREGTADGNEEVERTAKRTQESLERMFAGPRAAGDQTIEQMEILHNWEERTANQAKQTQESITRMFAGPREAGDLTLEQMEELHRRQAENTDAMARSSEMMDRIDRKAEDMKRSGRDLGLTFQSAFEDAIIEGEKFSDVLEGMAKDISRIILRRNVTEPLADSVSSIDWSSLFSSTGGSTGAGTGSSPNMATSAEGNVFTSPSVTSISERGHPEAVLPLERRNGTLGVRADGGGGSPAPIVNVYNESGGEAEVSERTDAGGRSVVDVLIPAVASGIQQGKLDGPLTKRFQGLKPRTAGRG